MCIRDRSPVEKLIFLCPTELPFLVVIRITPLAAMLPYKASIYYGMPALVKSTDTHEILDQITGDFEAMKEKYQVIIDEEEE